MFPMINPLTILLGGGVVRVLSGNLFLGDTGTSTALLLDVVVVVVALVVVVDLINA
jgi:hypothetical protein